MNVVIHKAVASEGREERRHMCPWQLPTTSMELRKNMAQEEVMVNFNSLDTQLRKEGIWFPVKAGG